MNGIGVLLGEGLLTIAPTSIMTMTSGLLFIGLGVYTLLKKSNGEEEFQKKEHGVFYATFASILFSEIGDKTNLSTIVLDTKFDAPLEVILSSISALAIVTSFGVILGTKLTYRFPKNYLQKFAGNLFIVIGALTVSGLI